MKLCKFFAIGALVGAAAAAEEADFNFAILGDRTGDHVPGVYGEIVAEVNRLGPHLVVSVGDNIEGNTEDREILNAEWDEYWGIAEKLAAPFYLSPGNHDIYNDVMIEVWKERTGREPCYSFDYEGVHFAILDTSRWEASEAWLEESGYREWLEKDLAAHKNDRLTVVIYHKPFWYDTLASGEPDPLHEIFKENGVDAVFNGHYHLYGATEFDGIRYTIVGSSGGGMGEEAGYPGTFFQYVWCTVRGDDLDWTVFEKGSALPRDTVTAADLRMVDKIESEYVRLPAFRLFEGAGTTEATCTAFIENATDLNIDAALEWESEANWLVEPPRWDVELAPGDGLASDFAVTLRGDFYPLPAFIFDYPYRAGRVHTYRGYLPAARVQLAAEFASPPAVDGVLEEEAWAEAPRATYFCSREGGEVTIDDTTFYFGYDASHLYLAARCEQEDMEALVATTTERDGAVYGDDCVGFFFCPDPEEKVFYQIYFNPGGVVFDQQVEFVERGRYEGEGPEWNGEYDVATARGEGYWTFEAAIPFATLGAEAPAKGEAWRLNFRRKEQAKGGSADWQYPISYEPPRFGYLVFE